MHTVGEFAGCTRNMDGELVASFIVPEDIKEDLLSFKKVTIDIKKYYEKRSTDANRYFWKLCTLIAEKLGSDKDTIYKLQLVKYGQFIDTEIEDGQADSLKKMFRFTDEYADPYYDGIKTIRSIRCYIGSSLYDRKEMGILINGTVEDAKDLGISTWSDDELFNLLERWKPHEAH